MPTISPTSTLQWQISLRSGKSRRILALHLIFTIFIYCLHYLDVASNHITPLLSQLLPAGLLRRADGEAKPGDDGAKPAIAEDVE